TKFFNGPGNAPGAARATAPHSNDESSIKARVTNNKRCQTGREGLPVLLLTEGTAPALILCPGIPIFGSTMIVLALGAFPGFSDQFGALTGEVLDSVSGASGAAVTGACGTGFRDSARIGTGESGLVC